MSDLVEFLRARLDEDEAAARAAIQGPWRIGSDEGASFWFGSGDIAQPLPEHCQHVLYGQSPIRPEGRVQVADLSAAWERDENAVHIVRWDPARVLAEVEAKRRAIERCRSIAEMDGWEYTDAPDLAEHVMLALAQPYSDHDDFAPAWRLA